MSDDGSVGGISPVGIVVLGVGALVVIIGFTGSQHKILAALTNKPAQPVDTGTPWPAAPSLPSGDILPLLQLFGNLFGISDNGIPTTIVDASTTGAGGSAEKVVAFARSKIGIAYQYGGTGNPGYDCSGLTQAAYKSIGVSIPRTTEEQILVGTGVAKANLQLGDLVFPDIGHVQIYSGGGKIIEAAHTGTTIREVPMWGFMAARRVL